MAFRDIIPWKKEDKSLVKNRDSEIGDPLYELDQWMDRFFDEPLFGLESSFRSYTPSADLSETETEYTITVDIPGFDEKDVDVLFQKNNLTIRGSKETETEKKHRHYHQIERKSGSFERSFYLPDEVDEQKIEAKYKHGVLTIRLPKLGVGQSTHKRIQIKSN